MRNTYSRNGGNGAVDYTARPAHVIETNQPAFSHTRPEGALGPYLRAIRAHRLAVALIVLAALAGAILYLLVRSATYESSADILITPVPQEDQTFLGVQIVRSDPSDPTRTVQTAANLLDTTQAAQKAAQRLGGDWTYRSVDQAVEVQPKGQSNILTVTAKVSTSANEAAKVANEFTSGALDARAETLRSQIDTALERLEAQLSGVPRDDTVTRAEIQSRISQLEAAREGRDPTLSLLQEARAPTGPSGAPKWLVLMLALLAGGLLAMGAALLMEMLERSVRDQDELLSLYPLPVLARVPRLSRRQRQDAEANPMSMPPAVREAFRTVRVQLEQKPGEHRRLMVTSGSSQDGKTTSAINLAFALVGAGHRVILIDFDLRKPGVASTLGIEGERGLVSLIGPDASLADALVPAPQLPTLKVLPAGGEGDVILLEALTRRLPDLLEEAEELADYVVIDTAPLGEVSDALRIADAVDDIIVAARPGHSNRAHFLTMRDLLQQGGINPLGYLVVGVSTGGNSSYYTYGFPGRRPAGDQQRPAGSSTPT
jgi:capsular exopolysaccharide synthesis family protein